MKLVFLFLLSVFIIRWKYILSDKNETLTYRLILNDDPASVEVSIKENETITISVRDNGESFGETLIDFKSGFIAIKGHEKNCYLFPIPSTAKFQQTERFLRSVKVKEEQTFCTANVSATNPYRIRNIGEYGPIIGEWCVQTETWGIFSITAEASGVEVTIESQAELSPFCIFVGFIFIFGRGQMACFRSVQTLKNMYAYKMEFHDHRPDVFLAAVCPPKEIPSRERNKIGYWITSQPGILYSEAAADPATMLYEYHGFSLYEIGLEGLMNLNTNQCVLVPIPQKSSLAADLKTINNKIKTGEKAENIVCNYRNGQQFYNMVNEIYRIQEFCTYDTVISIKNCRPNGNHYARERPCLFKGFLHSFENKYKAVCIQVIE